jgi:hypothetical protein
MTLQDLILMCNQLRKDHEASGTYESAKDYMAMTRTLRLIQSEAPHIVKRVEEIWEEAS